jgi:hypothetical protein
VRQTRIRKSINFPGSECGSRREVDAHNFD